MKLAVITIVYNLPPEIFLLQQESLEKYCKDKYTLIVIDNSSKEEMAEAIKYHCDLRGIEYTKTQASSKYGSESHAFALNVAHNKYMNEYDQFFYLDHDVIPFKNFSVEEILSKKFLAGIMQNKKKIYMWPGCMMISGEAKSQIDFSTNNRYGLDTGGNNWKVIEEYKNHLVEFSEEYRQNDQYSGFYNFYTVINSTFMHFINASAWNPTDDNEDRLNSLLNIYKTLEDEKNIDSTNNSNDGVL